MSKVYEPMKKPKDLSLGHIPARFLVEALREEASCLAKLYNEAPTQGPEARDSDPNYTGIPSSIVTLRAFADALEHAEERERKG